LDDVFEPALRPRGSESGDRAELRFLFGEPLEIEQQLNLHRFGAEVQPDARLLAFLGENLLEDRPDGTPGAGPAGNRPVDDRALERSVDAILRPGGGGFEAHGALGEEQEGALEVLVER